MGKFHFRTDKCQISSKGYNSGSNTTSKKIWRNDNKLFSYSESCIAVEAENIDESHLHLQSRFSPIQEYENCGFFHNC